MGDGSLTQDEIDALLQGADDFSGTPSVEAADLAGGGEAGGLSPSEKDVLTESMQDSLARSSGSISSYVSKEVKFANSYIDVQAGQALQDEFIGGYVAFQSTLSGQLNGDSNVLLPVTDAVKIAAALLSQENPPDDELDGAQEQALKEMMSPMITAYFVNLSNRVGVNFSSGPIKVVSIKSATDLGLSPVEEYTKITFSMNIAGLVDTKLIQVLPLSAAQTIAKTAMSAPAAGAAPAGGPGGGQMMAPQQNVNVESVEFPDMQGQGIQPSQANLNLLLDIKMDLTVELGRTRKYVKEILSLGEGSIIELDKLAGEPVDLLVNNKLIARGEVVVIDENFGVRVTDIVKPEERLRSMREGPTQ